MKSDSKVYPPLTPLQLQLYKERQQFLPVSRTWKTSDLYSLSGISDQYSKVTLEVPRTPWGRNRSYGGLAPVCLPLERRSKSEPPPLLQKGHHHFGSALGPFPRGVPIPQQYDLTLLKKSHVRTNDELLPRPQTTALWKEQLETVIPREHAYSSHMSRQALFPSPDVLKTRLSFNGKLNESEQNEEKPEEDKSVIDDDDDDETRSKVVDEPVKLKSRAVVALPMFHPEADETRSKVEAEPVKPKSRQVVALPIFYPEAPPSMVMHKARGSFGRREVVVAYTPNAAQSKSTSLRNIPNISIDGWFSKHAIITQFNKRYQSTTLPIMTRRGRRRVEGLSAT